MSTKKSRRTLVLPAIALFAIATVPACAVPPQKPNQQESRKIIAIKLTPENGISVTDNKGRSLKPCAPACTAENEKKYGIRCPDSNRALPVCKGLDSTSVTKVTTFTIIESAKNPYCYTSIFNGYYTEVCF